MLDEPQGLNSCQPQLCLLSCDRRSHWVLPDASWDILHIHKFAPNGGDLVIAIPALARIAGYPGIWLKNRRHGTCYLHRRDLPDDAWRCRTREECTPAAEAQESATVSRYFVYRRTMRD